MTNLKAVANFYHDSVGAKAYGETFVAPSQAVAQELERLGFVTQVDSKTVETAQMEQKREQLMGELQKMTNEAVERAHLVERSPSYEMQMQADKIEQQSQQARQQEQNQQQPNQTIVMNTESEEYKQLQQQEQQQQGQTAQSQQQQQAQANQNQPETNRTATTKKTDK